MVVELGGWDHLWADGEGCRAKVADRRNFLDIPICLNTRLRDRNGPAKVFMVALGVMLRLVGVEAIYRMKAIWRC
jgi:hypothetical protein